jgi:hypothetical protein
MTKGIPMKIRNLLFLVLPSAAVWLMWPGLALAQDGNCPAAKTDRATVWRVDTGYTVSLDPSIERCRSQIASSLMQWNPVISGTFGSSLSLLPPGSSGGSITVAQGIPPNPPPGEATAWWYALPSSDGLGLNGGRMHINPQSQDCRLVAQHFGHEIGHPSGLEDCSFCDQTASVMTRGPMTTYQNGVSGPQACDRNQLKEGWDWRVAPEREPEPDVDCSPDPDPFAVWTDPDCTQHPGDPDPLVVDVHGNGVALTSADEGVRFDVNADGIAERVAWTRHGSDDAWLVLDRNRNGSIDDGTELFGNVAPQPRTPSPNGYIALGELESTAQRGNGDHVVDPADAIWPDLRLWRDANHDGVSQPGELSTLSANGVDWLDVTPRKSGRRDRYGNFFRYRAKAGGSGGRWTYDVFLKNE